MIVSFVVSLVVLGCDGSWELAEPIPKSRGLASAIRMSCFWSSSAMRLNILFISSEVMLRLMWRSNLDGNAELLAC